MKNNRFPIRSLYCAAVLCLAIGQANAVLLYEDDFSGAAGSIVPTLPGVPRTPAVTWNSNTYQGVNTQPSVNGSGRAYSTNGGGAVSLALPSFTSGDIITMTLHMVTSGTNASGYIIGGFTKEANTLTSQGVLSAGLSNDGRLRIGSGTGTGNVYLSTTNDTGAVNTSGTWTSPLTIFTMTYNTGTGALNVTFDNDSISPYVWNGNVALTLSDLKYFTFQFAGVASSAAAYVDYLSVDVQPIPEPQAVVLILGGIGLFFVIRRARHRMMLCGK